MNVLIDERKRLSTQLLLQLLRIVTLPLPFSFFLLFFTHMYMYNDRMFVQYTICVLNYDIWKIFYKNRSNILVESNEVFSSSSKSSFIINVSMFYLKNILRFQKERKWCHYINFQIALIDNCLFFHSSVQYIW